MPAAPPAEEHDDAAADPEEERRHPGGADPARRRAGSAAAPAAARRAGACSWSCGRCASRARLTPSARADRYLTSASSCSFGRLANGGITPFGKPGCDVGVRIHDRLPDELLERLARLLRVRPAAYRGRARPSRSRRPRSSVWQRAAAVVLEDGLARPAAVGRRRRPSSGSAAHLSNAAGVMTIASCASARGRGRRARCRSPGRCRAWSA